LILKEMKKSNCKIKIATSTLYIVGIPDAKINTDKI